MIAEKAEQSLWLSRGGFGDRESKSSYNRGSSSGSKSTGGNRNSGNYNGPVPMELGTIDGKGKSYGDRSNIICHHCSKPGHVKRDCYKWKRENGIPVPNNKGKKQLNVVEELPPPPKN